MNAPRVSSSKPLWLLLLFLLAVIAGVIYWSTRPVEPVPPVADGDQPPSLSELTPQEAAEIFRQVQLANGHLELQEAHLPDAEQLLEELASKVPDEPLPARNLALCRYLLLAREKELDKVPGALSRLEAALSRLRELEPNSGLPYWLYGQALLKANPTRPEDALQQFEQAVQRESDSVEFLFTAYETAKNISAAEQPLAREFLASAYRVEPDNLYLLPEWLLAQAGAKDASISETLENAHAVFAPLRELVLKLHRTDLTAQLRDAAQAASDGNWNQVVRHARLCLNVTRNHDFTQSDKRGLFPHPLEFMLHELSPAFRERYPQTVSPLQMIDVSFAPFPDALQPPAFEDVRDSLLVDFDVDGRLDILLLRSRQLEVLRQPDANQPWTPLASYAVPSELLGEARGMLAADMDNGREKSAGSFGPETANEAATGCFEADSDVVLYGDFGVMVLRNVLDKASGTRTLQPVEQDAAFPMTDVVTAILVDFDHDANLDIVASTNQGLRLMLFRGDMTFVDMTPHSVLPEFPAGVHLTSLAAVDWDRDVDIDILAAAPGHAVGYFENLRHGNFRWRALDSGYELLKPSATVRPVEADGNVSWDLLGSGTSGVALAQTITPQPGAVHLKAARQLATTSCAGTTLGDIDNNGFQDVIGWTESSLVVWRADERANFTELKIPWETTAAPILHGDTGDVDNDGDLDLAVATAAGVTLLSNEGGNENNWLSIRAMGQSDNAGWANHHGIGSLLEIRSGPVYQAQVVTRPITHFGLGQDDQATVVRFLWTNGFPQDELNAVANQAICERMTLLGSCPYVYTWTGERFEFFTDCLWAAPIGLQLAEDVLAPSRSWEFLQIPGDRLRPRDGQYLLQVTEELWEAGYFDQIELLAVDHPAAIELFSNEKVGPPEISQFKLHPVRERHVPRAAHDQKGRDVLPHLLRADGDYLRAFDRTLTRGLAEEHFLELDLGELHAPQQIVLFLTGWIYPTSTSMNVGLSRDANLGGPRPPSVLVPDADGNWHEAQAFMGFPGGKTKTIAVDLSQAFLTDDYRVRIVTTAEIYWDEVFFAVDEPPAEMRLTPLPLEAADLHYRGFSQRLPRQTFAPDRYDYAQVRTEAKWPPMAGRFTRYGDVAELLTTADDRQVVLASGDEMTLAFAVPAAGPPAGWTRDFIMHNIGWDKDADLNTVFGQTVEPLPYQAMDSYPDAATRGFPDTPPHRDYLQRYQTRAVEPLDFWRQVKNFAH